MPFGIFVVLVLIAGISFGLGVVGHLIDREGPLKVFFFAVSGACAFGAVLGWLR